MACAIERVRNEHEHEQALPAVLGAVGGSGDSECGQYSLFAFSSFLLTHLTMRDEECRSIAGAWGCRLVLEGCREAITVLSGVIERQLGVSAAAAETVLGSW